MNTKLDDSLSITDHLVLATVCLMCAMAVTAVCYTPSATYEGAVSAAQMPSQAEGALP